MTEQKICSLCHVVYDGFGNNAAPFPGRCCDACNQFYVIPARLALISRELPRKEDR